MSNNDEDTIPDCISYQGFIIEPCPYKLTDDKGWSLHITIRKQNLAYSNIRHFSAQNTFKTREEAFKNGYVFGKQIIDGEYPGLSVTDL